MRIYRQVSNVGQPLVQRMRVFMCECCYVPSRLIKGKVKGIGVETDFRENLRTRHDSWNSDRFLIANPVSVTKSFLSFFFFSFFFFSPFLSFHQTLSFTTLQATIQLIVQFTRKIYKSNRQPEQDMFIAYKWCRQILRSQWPRNWGLCAVTRSG